MLIPFLDLSRQHKEVEAEINAALSRILSSGVYILGPEVTAFEREWAQFCGVNSAAGVASGTDALSLALAACGAIRPGHRDEVITSPLTAGYTVLPIIRAGAVPVFCDIDPQTLTLDPKAIEKAITPRTCAIIPVHLYGQMADMPAICDIAIRHNLFIIEDAAQAHGAELAGKRAGSYGHAAAFSFYPTKNLGAYGDAGAVVSDDAALIERVKILRQGGHESALRGTLAGKNSRLDELQAAILRVKLEHLAAWNEQRRAMAQNYHTALRSTSLQLPFASVREAHVYHLYVVRCSRREELRAHLAKRGIETMIHYPFLVHLQPLFRQDNSNNLVPVAENVAEQILSLPLYPQLRNEEAQAVIDAVLEFEAS